MSVQMTAHSSFCKRSRQSSASGVLFSTSTWWITTAAQTTLQRSRVSWRRPSRRDSCGLFSLVLVSFCCKNHLDLCGTVMSLTFFLRMEGWNRAGASIIAARDLVVPMQTTAARLDHRCETTDASALS